VFVCAVCTFIGKLLRAVLPDVAWDNAFLQSEDDFSASLDGVIRKHAREGSNEGDCRLAMAQMACNRMKHVCDLLKRISESVGLKEIAGRYLDAPWFVDLLLRKDTSKLNKLYYTIDFTDEKPSHILMNVAAILEGRTDGYDAMSAHARIAIPNPCPRRNDRNLFSAVFMRRLCFVSNVDFKQTGFFRHCL